MDSEDEVNADRKIIIQTYNGKIHASETVAVALMTNYYAQKGINVSVLRSRDPEKFETSDILIGVGDIYDASNGSFDYHQPYFNETWDGFTIPLSSAGLIWKHFGNEILQMYLTVNSEHYGHGSNYSDETIEDLKNIIYSTLILEIDASSHSLSNSNMNSLNIPSIVKACNGDTSNENLQNENFRSAVGLVGAIFDIKFKEIINSYFNFAKDLEIVKTFDLTSEYLIITQNIPTVFKCLNELDPEHHVKFLIFYNEEREEYTIKARRGNEESQISQIFQIFQIAPQDFLKAMVTYPNDIIFIHKGSFMAKSKTLETAIEIVEYSLRIEPQENKKEVIKIPKIEFKNLPIIAGGVGTFALLGYLYLRNRSTD